MKVRNGFVSNSSSSSFFIACPKKVHDKALKTLHPYYQKWIKEMLGLEEQMFGKEKILVSSYHYCSEIHETIKWDKEYPPEAEEFDGWDEDDNKKVEKMVDESKIISIYVGALKKESNDVIFEESQG